MGQPHPSNRSYNYLVQQRFLQQIQRGQLPAGTCLRKYSRTCWIVRAFKSDGSFHGNTVFSARGAKAATSREACNGCAGVSSGMTSIGVWHPRANSRDTL